MLKLDGSASELHFNPKEDKLAVALAKNPLIDEHLMFRKVHIVDLKTNKASNLNNPGKLGQLAWSPDGKKLAMITGADKHDPREGQLWLWAVEQSAWIKPAPNKRAWTPIELDLFKNAHLWRSRKRLPHIGCPRRNKLPAVGILTERRWNLSVFVRGAECTFCAKFL